MLHTSVSIATLIYHLTAIMFDFEKFTVYTKSEEYYQIVLKEVFSKKINNNLRDQLQRASTSILLNIAE